LFRDFIISLTTVILLLSVTVCVVVSAQDGAGQNRGLTVTPLRSELEVSPGTSVDGVLTITNLTDTDMKVGLSAEEFSVIDQQYDYAFTAESNLAKWVLFGKSSVNLQAGESQSVSYKVGAPLSAEPGGRYISLFASTDSADSNSGISTRQRVASLLYITVLGDVSRSGSLVSLAAPWLMSGNDIWSATLRNTGTTHYRSQYMVSVYNIFGNAAATSDINDSLILPGTIRTISGTVPTPQLPGIYRVVFKIGLGDTPARFESRYVLYMPPAAWIALTVFLAMFIWYVMSRLKHKRAN
jgi:hypothetical protein